MPTPKPSKPAKSPKPKQRKGFALHSPERRREIAASGGNATAKSDKRHVFSVEEAREAGKLGAAARWKKQGDK